MCEKCGFSGCRHDWQNWAPAAFWRGYDDAMNGREQVSPDPDKHPLSAGGYNSGYIVGKIHHG